MNDHRTNTSICAESVPPTDLTLTELIGHYRIDPVSRYRKLRYATRINHDSLLRRMEIDYGHMKLAEIRVRTLEEMYLNWSADETKIPMGHMFMSKLRTICAYGAGMLENMDCARICHALSQRKFEMIEKANSDFMTAAQATAIRNKAREFGFPSMALAEAFQFDCLLRQRDCIGEWVPRNEKGDSDTFHKGWKWLRGLRWEEIDSDLVLTHVTSKKQKELVVPLTEAPMVMEELRLMPSFMKRRTGPVIVCEATALPWKVSEFRRKWRMIADACGVPPEVKNMHSRSGGISEGTNAGIPLEHLRHAAKHSDIATTQRYSRDSDQKVVESLRRRVAHRQALQGDK